MTQDRFRTAPARARRRRAGHAARRCRPAARPRSTAPVKTTGRPGTPPRTRSRTSRTPRWCTPTIARGRITAIDTAAAEARGRGARRAHPPERAAAEAHPAGQPARPSHDGRRDPGELPEHRRGALGRPAGRGRRRGDAWRRRSTRRPTGRGSTTNDCRPSSTSRPRQGAAAPVRGMPMSPARRAARATRQAALAAAPVSVDLRFTTPAQNHNAMEPHATTAVWDGDRLTVHESDAERSTGCASTSHGGSTCRSPRCA